MVIVFLYAVCNSWNRQLSFRKPIDLHSLKCKIFVETITNIDNYSNFCLVSPNTCNGGISKNLRRYLLDKVYDNEFGDIVPVITANALDVHLSFLNINANSVNLVKIYSNGVDKGKLLVHCSNNHYSTVEWKKKPQVQLEPSSKIVKYTPDELHALVKFGRLSRKKTEKPFSSLDFGNHPRSQ